MTDGNPTTAVLLINLGGPDSLDSVEPFLYNLFSDPDIMGYNRVLNPLLRPLARYIARKRTPQVKKYYSMIGGKSPIVKLTMQQGKALEDALSAYGNIWVFVSMRYCRPTIEEAVEDMLTFPLKKIIVLPLYPHYSVTTTGSSINEFNREFNRAMRQPGIGNIEICTIKEWYDNPTYIDAMCDTIQKTIESHKLNIRKTHIVFSAHGIPLRFIRRGDPYAKQIEKCAVLVAGKLGAAENYHLSYQSRVGPLRWLGPSTDEVLKELGKKGAKDVMLVPISFVSDHVETLYEMDILYKEKAMAYGITNFYRVPALNDSPLLIDALKDIVLQAYIGNPSTSF
ncbi:MAG: ferrochelatase [Nitrospirae bacterium]|nr:ferrochelatase [Nitrospirota bacterium]